MTTTSPASTRPGAGAATTAAGTPSGRGGPPLLSGSSPVPLPVSPAIRRKKVLYTTKFCAGSPAASPAASSCPPQHGHDGAAGPSPHDGAALATRPSNEEVVQWADSSLAAAPASRDGRGSRAAEDEPSGHGDGTHDFEHVDPATARHVLESYLLPLFEQVGFLDRVQNSARDRGKARQQNLAGGRLSSTEAGAPSTAEKNVGGDYATSSAAGAGGATSSTSPEQFVRELRLYVWG